MSREKPCAPRCFFSKCESLPWRPQLQARVKGVLARHGLGIETVEPAQGRAFREVDPNIVSKVNSCLMMLVEASEFSWYVARELFLGWGRMPVGAVAIKDGQKAGFPKAKLGVSLGRTVVEYRSLSNRKHLPELRKQLEDTVRDLLARVSEQSEAVAKSFRRRPPVELPIAPVDPRCDLDGAKAKDGRRLRPEDLADACRAKPVVLLASEGCGKTLLLERLWRYIRDNYPQRPQGVEELRPLVLYFSSKDIEDVGVSVTQIWSQIRSRVDAAAGLASGPNEYSLFDVFADAGLVYLLFDGLDEFGIRHRKELLPLACALADCRSRPQGVSVVVTCRRSFWRDVVFPRTEDARQRYREISLADFNQEDAKAVLGAVRLGRLRAPLYENGKLAPWALNPQIIRLLLDLCDRTEAPLEGLTTRFQVYKVWSNSRCEADGEAWGVLPDRVRRFYCALAFEVLQKRSPNIAHDRFFEIAEKELGIAPQHPAGDRAVLAARFARSEVILPPMLENRATFVHTRFQEFFAVLELIDEFKLVGEGKNLDWGSCRLNQVELDFLQTVAYGHFQDALGKDFTLKLAQFVETRRFPALPPNVQRNFIEYIGMTTGQSNIAGEDFAALVERLMWIVEARSRFDYKVRFNASRALERIHPCAPRPYVEHISDWGHPEYSVLRKVDGRDVVPWVMRGTGEPYAIPGRHFRFGYCRVPGPENELRRTISERIRKYLVKSLRSVHMGLPKEWSAWLSPNSSASGESRKSGEEAAVRISLSNAWIRWIDPRHINAARTIAKQASTTSEHETVENLDTWAGIIPEFTERTYAKKRAREKLRRNRPSRIP